MYQSTVRCQRDIVCGIKIENPVIRSTTHNLLLQWMENLLLQLLLVEQKHGIANLYQSICNLIKKKKYALCLILSRNTCFMWIAILWATVWIHIVVTKYQCIVMHRWIISPIRRTLVIKLLIPPAPTTSGSGHETVAVLLPGFAINW